MITNSLTDTISAIATVIGTGGVSIIRLSGENSQEVISKILPNFEHMLDKKDMDEIIKHILIK